MVERMGLYDIWTILFPGTVFVVAIKSVYNFMLLLPEQMLNSMSINEQIFILCKISVYTPSTIYNLLIFLIYSYLSGLVLHEISSIFKNSVIYKHGKPTDFLLEPKEGLFNEEQIQKLMPMYVYLSGDPLPLEDKEKLRKESRLLFHKMNVDLQRRKMASQYVKLNIIYNTSATLGVTIAFILGIILSFEIEFIILGELYLLLSFVSLDMMLIIAICILMNRSKKYYKYWVKNIVMAFYDLYLITMSESYVQN